MPKTASPYQPLTGIAIRRASAFELSASRARLYLAEDHLLMLEKTYYRESYRRFYYRDIQALVLEKTKGWLWYGLTWLGFTLLFLVCLLAAWDSGSRYFFLPFAMLCFMGLVINGVAGPTCQCYLRTAVQYEVLPGMHRVRKTEQLLQRLRARILAAQPAAAAVAPETMAVTLTTAEPETEGPAAPTG